MWRWEGPVTGGARLENEILTAAPVKAEKAGNLRSADGASLQRGLLEIIFYRCTPGVKRGVKLLAKYRTTHRVDLGGLFRTSGVPRNDPESKPLGNPGKTKTRQNSANAEREEG